MAARLQWTAISVFTDPDDLVNFTAPTKEIRWNSDDEFWYQGKLYDATSINIVHDTLYCAVLEDNYETAAYAQMFHPGLYKYANQDQPILIHHKLGLRPLAVYLEGLASPQYPDPIPTIHIKLVESTHAADGYSGLIDHPPMV